MEERVKSKDLIGKVLISEETGKKFGVIGDIDYISESGELINLALAETTSHTTNLNLQTDVKNRMLIPFSAVVKFCTHALTAQNTETAHDNSLQTDKPRQYQACTAFVG